MGVVVGRIGAGDGVGGGDGAKPGVLTGVLVRTELVEELFEHAMAKKSETVALTARRTLWATTPLRGSFPLRVIHILPLYSSLSLVRD